MPSNRTKLPTIGLLLLLGTSCVSHVDFDAMSANIRYGTARDGDNAWPLRRDLVASTIVAEAPEILGVQEALAFQLEFLAQHLPHHRQVGVGRDGGDRGEHAALYIDSRAFDIVEHGDFWLSETPAVVASVGWDAALPRICTWARVRSRAHGRELTVWNVHFDHRGKQARLKSAQLLAQRVASAPGPHLVLGDLNTGENSPPLLALDVAGLHDTFRDIHPDATTVGTFGGFRGKTTGAKIDYVLATDDVVTVDAAILTAPDADGRWPSDHFFVTATLRY
ncbi:MAG: endonuclease/exonuclease/phosphatase family protein [bacterium]|nr:endonuclease/exonuclease/phosphatase family protein [bacterium]